MKKTITILGKKFTLNDDEEYQGKISIWGRETEVWIETELEDDYENNIIERINWLNENRDAVISAFMEKNDHYVGVINEMIESGEFKADKPITEEDYANALFVRYLNIIESGDETEISLDLDAEPDYLLGHLACMEISSVYKVECGGING